MGLEVFDLSVRLGGREVLKHVSFTLSSGSILVLLGPNGAGKTTLLKSVVGLVRPYQGKIVLNSGVVFNALNGDVFVNVPPWLRRVGYVPQKAYVFPHMSVFENVAFGLKRLKLSNVELRGRVKAVSEIVGIEGILHRKAAELSGGEAQRVALARALAIEPELLLLDEPFANIDPSSRDRIRFELMSLLKKLKVTAIITTHLLEDLWVSDVVGVIIDGRLKYFGSDPKALEGVDVETAEFLNIPVISGKVVEVYEGRVKVYLGLDSFIYAYSDKRLKPGDEVYVAVDPEEVKVSEGGDGVKAEVLYVKETSYLRKAVLKVGNAVVTLPGSRYGIKPDVKVVSLAFNKAKVVGVKSFGV